MLDIDSQRWVDANCPRTRNGYDNGKYIRTKSLISPKRVHGLTSHATFLGAHFERHCRRWIAHCNEVEKLLINSYTFFSVVS